MTSLLAYPFENIFRKSALDEEIAREKKIKLEFIEWVNPIRKGDAFIVPVLENIDNFEYPSIMELRKQFKATGLYSKEKIDKIIEAYERLPKYRAQRNSAPRGRKRG